MSDKSLSLPHELLPAIPIGHPDTMMSVESVRRAVEEFQTQPTDVIVATFAKTGTTLVTWLCHLIRLYTTDAALDLEQHLASLETLYQVVPWPLLSWDIGYDPNVDGSQYTPRIFKSHLRMASIYRGPAVRYIVTIRDPGKTALSFYNFFLAKQVPLAQNMDASQFLKETPFVQGRPGRASLWEYYQEYHVLRNSPAVLMMVYEDIVKDMPQAIRQISQFMNCSLSDDQIETVASKSTKDYMAQHMSLFDEPYERAKSLNRAGDISQLAPGAKVATQQHPQKLNEAAQSFLKAKWKETMAPLGYDGYDDFVAMVRARNDKLFSQDNTLRSKASSRRLPFAPTTAACMVMFFILTASSGRLATAFVVPRYSKNMHHQRIISSATSSTRIGMAGSSDRNYSEATIDRLQGLDAEDEFSKLATKLNTPPKQLKVVLTKRLAGMDLTLNDGTQEKAEYLDWLLSGSTGGGDEKNGSTFTSKAKPKPPVNRSPVAEKKKPVRRMMSTESGGEKQTFATEVTFADRPDLHPNSKRAVAAMGLTTMTEIQDRTFSAASSGKDVLGRARTGTGKTVAFLLPAIERLLQMEHTQNNIGILVISPTRELATQIGDQAEKLSEFHRGMSVQVMFGGTNMKRDITRLSQRLPTILVATPGRLLDHLQSTRLNGKQSFGRDVMSKTPLVILDETDRLLDMGFRREISKILGYMPRSTHRQTLLFSATIPPDLKAIMAQNMKPDYIEVDCINDGDAASHTNAQVQQSHVILPANSDRFVSSVIEVVRLALEYDSAETPAKIVVFFPTARLVNFFAEVFDEGNIASIPVLELHSKKSQSYRNRVSEDFRKAKRGILFTSDVSARGVDYPNVSHVIQFGMPESRDQYIHRLGRTGRGGTEGRGWLVLSEWESLFLQELKGVDIPVDEELRQMMTDPITPESQGFVEEIQRRIGSGDKILSKSAKGAYQAFLGYYLGQMKRMRMKRKEDLVAIANDFASLSGLREPPTISKMLVGKMGLKNVQGVNIGAGEDRGPPRGGGGGGGGRGGGRNASYGHNDGRRAPQGRRR